MNTFNQRGMPQESKPKYYAIMKGSKKYPAITGLVTFYERQGGFWISITITGLPISEEKCVKPFFGFHVHEGGDCKGNEEKPYANVGGHFNPTNCPHGAHVGDLLPLYARDGVASMYYYISGIDLNLFKGRTLIVHRDPDDFTTQPSGNSGEMIACGVIE